MSNIIENSQVWTVTLSRDGTVDRTLTFDGRNAKFRAESYARDRTKDGAFDTPIIPMLISAEVSGPAA